MPLVFRVMTSLADELAATVGPTAVGDAFDVINVATIGRGAAVGRPIILLGWSVVIIVADDGRWGVMMATSGDMINVMLMDGQRRRLLWDMMMVVAMLVWDGMVMVMSPIRGHQ